MHRLTATRATDGKGPGWVGGFALAVVALAAACWPAAPAGAGHESPFYPSFYPQAIRIEAVDPASARPLLPTGALHAYVGGDPFGAEPLPADVGSARSFGAFVVVTFDVSRPAWRDPAARCAAAARLARALRAPDGTYAVHPYPVTPYHPDYLQHADLVRSAARRLAGAGEPAPAARPLRLGVQGDVAGRLVPPGWRALDGEAPEAIVEALDLDALLAPLGGRLNGWIGPPWRKAGWFHTYLLYADVAVAPAARAAADDAYRRLTTGMYRDAVERVNLERALVRRLTGGCERAVVGYTTLREPFSTAFSNGIENVAFDSQAGLGSAVFVRTAKLKDFPWNGWMKVGVAAAPAAAWNPIGGFTDRAGRLVWSAVGDPALFPEPYGGSFVPNRATSGPAAAASGGAVPVPPDALVPAPGSGALEPAGAGKTAKAKIVYRLLGSLFHDGTPLTMADVLYPFAFAARWSTREGAGDAAYDPRIAESTRLLLDWLVALRPVGVEQQTRNIGDVTLTYDIPVVEVYLRHRAPDPELAAAVAPPWSSLPWHLLALAEAAVEGGAAAFSAAEAASRGVPWLDLARDQPVKAELASRLDRFARDGYVPPALAPFVTADEARARWAALRRFFRQHAHFLVANGPYLLDRWSPDGAVLQVFRDLTYPLGVGTFDRFAVPRRAFVARAERHGDRLEIFAEAERIFRFQRTYELVREPFGSQEPADSATPDTLVCRYLVIGPDGEVVEVGTAAGPDGARFTIDLRRAPGPGGAVAVALYLNGNTVDPDVRVIPLERGGAS